VSTSKKNVVRFAVGEPAAPQSQPWRLWVQGDEIYLGATDVLRAVKVSLHKSGVWRIAEVAELKRDDPAKDRVIARWQRPAPLQSGLTPAIAVTVSPRPASKPFSYHPQTNSETEWLAPPALGYRIQFLVVAANSDASIGDLPFAGTNTLVRSLQKRNGEHVWLVCNDAPLDPGDANEIDKIMRGIKIHLKIGVPESKVKGGRAIQMSWPNEVTALAPPILLDVALGLENLQYDA
jgi:hypothetical protein